MQQTWTWLLLELPLILLTAIGTHFVISFGQTFLHARLAHRAFGRQFFRNHINFHHKYYSNDHLVSDSYRGIEGNNTPHFVIPILLVGTCTYFILPIDLFFAQLIACAASFYAHVFFDKEYHREKPRLQKLAWFRRRQQLHFVHHRHADSNFAVIDFFWDRLLGTYRPPDEDEPLGLLTPQARLPPARTSWSGVVARRMDLPNGIQRELFQTATSRDRTQRK